MSLVRRIVSSLALEWTQTQSVRFGRRRDNLPHSLGNAEARRWSHRFGIEVALLQREVQELTRQMVLQQNVGNTRAESLGIRPRDARAQLLGIPTLDVLANLIHEAARHGRFGLAEPVDGLVDQLDVFGSPVAVDPQCLEQVSVLGLEARSPLQ